MKPSTDYNLKETQKLLELLARLKSKLLSYPNVSNVDIGFKFIKGEMTKTLSIRVFVSKKVPLNTLTPANQIPASMEGIPVDVIEAKFEKVILPKLTEDGKWHNIRFEPLAGGCTIQGAGTFGALVFDRKNLLPLGLTNEHVVNNVIGADVVQPNFGVAADKIGTVLRTSNTLDAAVISMLTSSSSRTLSRRIIDTPWGITGIAEPSPGMKVHKSGASTGLTCGIVDGVSGSSFSVRPDPERPADRYKYPGENEILTQGDSGSVYIETSTGFVVGLLHSKSWVQNDPKSLRAHGSKLSKVSAELGFVVEPATGSLTAVARKSGNIELYIRSRFLNSLMHRSWNGAGWSEWKEKVKAIDSDPIPSDLSTTQWPKIDSGPAVCSWGENRQDIFFRREDNKLYHNWWTGQDWNIVENLGGNIISTPTAESWGNGRIDVFARGNDDSLQQIYFENGWSKWFDLGKTITSKPAVCSWASGRLDVFARSLDNCLWHIWFSNGKWSAWENLGGQLIFGPAAVSWGPGRIDVFAVGTDRALHQKTFDGTWKEWNHLGGICASEPAACSWGPNRLDVFVETPDQSVAHKWFNGKWSDWGSLGGVVHSDSYLAP